MTQGKTEQYYEAYLNHHRISRRGLLRGLFRPVENVVETQSLRTVPRPPFCAEEELFLIACNGCGNCVTACPNNLIQLEQGKAILSLDYSPCTLCGQCAQSCQTGALHLAFPADTGLRPTFLSDCLHYKNQFCDTCQTACPQQAISANLDVNSTACNGCGECQVSCFMNAVKLELNKK